uniref:Uncharacterized protein n=1 Tax=Arundo donax TaxID=35708 RepID=A0A0A9D7G1_ARUDO
MTGSALDISVYWIQCTVAGSQRCRLGLIPRIFWTSPSYTSL